MAALVPVCNNAMVGSVIWVKCKCAYYEFCNFICFFLNHVLGMKLGLNLKGISAVPYVNSMRTVNMATLLFVCDEDTVKRVITCYRVT